MIAAWEGSVSNSPSASSGSLTMRSVSNYSATSRLTMPTFISAKGPVDRRL